MRGFTKSKKKHLLKISVVYLIGNSEICQDPPSCGQDDQLRLFQTLEFLEKEHYSNFGTFEIASLFKEIRYIAFGSLHSKKLLWRIFQIKVGTKLQWFFDRVVSPSIFEVYALITFLLTANGSTNLVIYPVNSVAKVNKNKTTKVRRIIAYCLALQTQKLMWFLKFIYP